MKILIADSGATKTDWLFVNGKEFTQVRTHGLHPATIEEISDLEELKMSVGNLDPSKIYFFGTNCGNPVSDEKIRLLLNEIFPGVEAWIDSDLAGSAKAFFDNSDGTIIILGTGAVSAKIEQGKVVRKSAALGYAIGDEGSAADLGRRIVKMYYRNTGAAGTIQFIRKQLNGMDYSTMMNRIYTAAKPNRELASIAGEVLQKPYPEELDQVIKTAFGDFIDHQLAALKIPHTEKIVATGKVAHIHQKILLSLLKEKGYPNADVHYPVISAFREKILTSEITF
ncbi:MAG: hypothetical protein WD604_07500 [Balneolaceae bacterium]